MEEDRGEQERQSKEEYIIMKKHDESREEGSMVDVTATWGISARYGAGMLAEIEF